MSTIMCCCNFATIYFNRNKSLYKLVSQSHRVISNRMFGGNGTHTFIYTWEHTQAYRNTCTDTHTHREMHICTFTLPCIFSTSWIFWIQGTMILFSKGTGKYWTTWNCLAPLYHMCICILWCWYSLFEAREYFNSFLISILVSSV